jgi:hypothetical protein
MCDGDTICVLCYPFIDISEIDAVLEGERAKTVSALDSEGHADDRCFILGDFILWRQEYLQFAFMTKCKETKHTRVILEDACTQYKRKLRLPVGSCGGKHVATYVNWFTPMYVHSVPFNWILSDKDAALQMASMRLFVLSPRKDLLWVQKPYLLPHAVYLNVVSLVYK